MMPKIDFYVIESSHSADRLQMACRLTEKAYKNKHRIYIHANHQAEAHQLDELLWTYREESFLPHNLLGEGPDPAPPIQIGFELKPPQHRDILLNLNDTVPEFYTAFSRILELVTNEANVQALARERYRFYRSAGHDIKTHKLQSIEA